MSESEFFEPVRVYLKLNADGSRTAVPVQSASMSAQLVTPRVPEVDGSIFGADHAIVTRILQTSPDLIVDGVVANAGAVALRIVTALAERGR